MAEHRDRAIAMANTAELLLEDALRPEPDSHLAPTTLIEAASAYALLAGVRLQLADSKPEEEAPTKAWPHPVGNPERKA